MADEEDEEEQCWECGESPASECKVCVSGEEYCSTCLADHNALEHDDEAEQDQ